MVMMCSFLLQNQNFLKKLIQCVLTTLLLEVLPKMNFSENKYIDGMSIKSPYHTALNLT